MSDDCLPILYLVSLLPEFVNTGRFLKSLTNFTNVAEYLSSFISKILKERDEAHTAEDEYSSLRRETRKIAVCIFVRSCATKNIVTRVSE